MKRVNNVISTIDTVESFYFKIGKRMELSETELHELIKNKNFNFDFKLAVSNEYSMKSEEVLKFVDLLENN